MNPHPMDMIVANATPKPAPNIAPLARHYEEAAKDMRLWAQDLKALAGP